MKINELAPAKGSRKPKKRVGRGQGSGHGGTACRGHKGQLARSGGGTRPGFEGGQMPLHRRLPKRGFTNIFSKRYSVINVGDLARFEPDSSVDVETLKAIGLVKQVKDGVKLLGKGDIAHSIRISVHKVSQSARRKVEAAGGTVEVI
jgi:large subunit ribosomal protein L15